MDRNRNHSLAWSAFSGPNAGYLMELYEQYCADPGSVGPEMQSFFVEQEQRGGTDPRVVDGPLARPNATLSALPDVVKAVRLIADLRQYGHRAVAFDPFTAPESAAQFDPATCGLSPEVLAATPASLLEDSASSLGDTVDQVLQTLGRIYLGKTGIEFEHVSDETERTWLRQQVERPLQREWKTSEREHLLCELLKVEEFEHFLHTTFPGQKRFSVEGVDVLIPVLNYLIGLAAAANAESVVLGMAHRGRLNVLANVMGKPLPAILTEFLHGRTEHLEPDSAWTGDVKYHLGYRTHQEFDGHLVQVILANNPSHLELVNPVAEGQTRALQDNRKVQGESVQAMDAAMAIVVHGDAAFTGEGVVTETLNLSGLSAYRSGGTIHIISNNDIGFTTNTTEERFTRYASDVAKGYDIPILHVSADDPETVLAAVDLAFRYRTQFHKDFLIDVVGYRRWGHNEGDEPAFTQPRRYAQIAEHKTVADLYGRTLLDAEVIPADFVNQKRSEYRQILVQAHQIATRGAIAETFGEPAETPERPTLEAPTADQLRAWNQALLRTPSDFHLHPKLERVLSRHLTGLDQGESIDWAWAESLALASILSAAIPIRFSGQDTERGTFSQRHLVWHDVRDDAVLVPLAEMAGSQASFDIHNSPLSEVAALGFEYGYSVRAPEALVIWEAQFGDFANVAQPIIDQFVAAGQAKWRQSSNLVMLLPHGYEGQGPEHSSARLERYLQLAADGNLCVANCTNAAQYFHLLRRQASQSTPIRPLILMTPKSLLRHPMAQCHIRDLTSGQFHEVLELPLVRANEEPVERVVITSGKVAIDLKVQAESGDTPVWPGLRVLRLEQLYPIPASAIREYLAQFPQLSEVYWLQEEPKNMGAWGALHDVLETLLPDPIHLQYVGRPERASVANGNADIHAAEQIAILDMALQPTANRAKVRL